MPGVLPSSPRGRGLALGLAALLVLGLVGALWVYQVQALRAEIRALKGEGRRALAAGEAARAIEALSRYLDHHPEDTGALRTLAEAHWQVPEAGGRHRERARALYRRVVRRRPGDIEAVRRLMEMAARAGDHETALTWAETVLEREPEDRAALGARTEALVGLGRTGEALEAAQARLRLDPLDLEHQLAVMRLLRARSGGASAMLEHARALVADHPESPVSHLVRALAAAEAGERDRALEAVRRVAASRPRDPRLLEQAAALFEGLGRALEALVMLETAHEAAPGEPEIVRLLARRLAWWGNDGRTVRRLGGIDPAAAPAEAVAVLALARMRAAQPAGGRAPEQPVGGRAPEQPVGGRAPEQPATGRAPERTLAERAEPWPQAWAAALAWQREGGAARRRAWLEAARRVGGGQGGKEGGAHALFELLRGAALLEAGAARQARKAWARAAALAPSWPEPLIRTARSLADARRFAEAYEAARAALERRPDDVTAALELAEVWHANLDRWGEASARELLDLVERIRGAAPANEAAWPLWVDLLARVEGIERARGAIDRLRARAPGPRTVLRLAEVSRAHDLGRDVALLRDGLERHGWRPELAYAGAALGSEIARRRLETPPDDEPAWRIARATFLDQAAPGEAGAAWRDAVRAHPENGEVLQAALASPWRWEDPAWTRELIERLRRIAGPGAVSVEVAEARWRLEHGPWEAGAAEAATRLSRVLEANPDHLQARLLQARALLRLGDRERARAHLERAERIRPDPVVRFALADLLSEAGAWGESLERFVSVAEDEAAAARLRRAAAERLAGMGAFERAEGALEAIRRSTGAPAGPLAVRLALRRGELEAARAQLEPMLASRPSLEAILLAADVAMAAGAPGEAERMLERLETLAIPDGRRELARAEWLARDGRREAALGAARRATEAAPAEAAGWRERIALEVALGRVEALQASLRQVSERDGEGEADERLAWLTGDPELLVRAAAGDEAARGLAAVAVRWPAVREAAFQALQAALPGPGPGQARGGDREAHGERASPARRKLLALARTHERNLPVQLFVAARELAAGRFESAARVAERAADRHPASTRPLALAARARAAAGHRREALEAARRWASRAPAADPQPRLWAARLLLEDGRPAEALERLGELPPGAGEAVRDEALALTCRALARLGRAEEAAARLEPRLQEGAAWRHLWLELARHLEPGRAVAWLETAAGHPGAGAPAHRGRRAMAWFFLARRSGESAHAARARRLARDVAADERAAPEDHLRAARVLEALGEGAEAARAYRRVLASEGDWPLARNNLAMLILERGGDLAEAAALARRAVRADPDEPAYHDTLARVRLGAGEHGGALAAAREAVDLAPQAPAWRLTLAEVLAAAGDHAASRAALADPAFAPDRLGASDRARWEALRRRGGDGAGEGAG